MPVKGRVGDTQTFIDRSWWSKGFHFHAVLRKKWQNNLVSPKCSPKYFMTKIPQQVRTVYDQQADGTHPTGMHPYWNLLRKHWLSCPSLFRLVGSICRVQLSQLNSRKHNNDRTYFTCEIFLGFVSNLTVKTTRNKVRVANSDGFLVSKSTSGVSGKVHLLYIIILHQQTD